MVGLTGSLSSPHVARKGRERDEQRLADVVDDVGRVGVDGLGMSDLLLIQLVPPPTLSPSRPGGFEGSVLALADEALARQAQPGTLPYAAVSISLHFSTLTPRMSNHRPSRSNVRMVGRTRKNDA